jgi:hypothetical protein
MSFIAHTPLHWIWYCTPQSLALKEEGEGEEDFVTGVNNSVAS